jgi:cyclophilin family peptidyl-prolyl cis-trans isomerase
MDGVTQLPDSSHVEDPHSTPANGKAAKYPRTVIAAAGKKSANQVAARFIVLGIVLVLMIIGLSVDTWMEISVQFSCTGRTTYLTQHTSSLTIQSATAVETKTFSQLASDLRNARTAAVYGSTAYKAADAGLKVIDAAQAMGTAGIVMGVIGLVLIVILFISAMLVANSGSPEKLRSVCAVSLLVLAWFVISMIATISTAPTAEQYYNWQVMAVCGSSRSSVVVSSLGASFAIPYITVPVLLLLGQGIFWTAPAVVQAALDKEDKENKEQQEKKQQDGNNSLHLTHTTGAQIENHVYCSTVGPTMPAQPVIWTYFDIAIDNQWVGRIVFHLFPHVAPKTCENFRALCTGEKGFETKGRPLSYKGTYFHRILAQFMVQGGDTTFGDGSACESIYGGLFEDESFVLKHDRPGVLSMANSGPNTNGSQFFITLAPAPWLDGHNVAFGEIVEGMDVIQRMESLATPSGVPSHAVAVVDCGQLPGYVSGPMRAPHAASTPSQPIVPPCPYVMPYSGPTVSPPQPAAHMAVPATDSQKQAVQPNVITKVPIEHQTAPIGELSREQLRSWIIECIPNAHELAERCFNEQMTGGALVELVHINGLLSIWPDIPLGHKLALMQKVDEHNHIPAQSS